MEERRGEETFLSEIITGGRVTVPHEVRKKIGLKHGDLVKIKIIKVEPGEAE